MIRLVRPGRKPRPMAGKAHIQDVEGNISDRAVWEGILEDVNIVFHFAAQTSVYVAAEDPQADLEINVLPMLHLLETCRRRGCQPTVVFAGTVTEVGLPVDLPVNETHPDQPLTVYDLHKCIAESYLKHYVREGVVRGTVLRLANVYGPGPKSSSADRGLLNGMIRKALRGETLTIYGHGKYMRDYVYVEDAAQAFLRAGAKIDPVNGRHFVIGSGKGHTLAEVLNLVADRVALRTGQRVSVIHTAPPTQQSPIEARNFVADTTGFAQATGWTARVSLVEGIDLTIEYCLKELQEARL
jgi:nucleoside-diphosphate-sugar epimerase